ncbi:MAG: DUF1801 domain-containing protein [Anaerolineae bacterium]
MNQQVTEYIDKITQDWQLPIAKRLREIVHQSVPGIEERLQYSKPHYLKNGKYAAVIGTAKGWVSFTIFNAAELKPPSGLFEESEVQERRTVKIRKDQQVDYDLLAKLLKQAAESL